VKAAQLCFEFIITLALIMALAATALRGSHLGAAAMGEAWALIIFAAIYRLVLHILVGNTQTIKR